MSRYTCPEGCGATFEDGITMHKHIGEHIEAEWQEIRRHPSYTFTIPDEEPTDGSQDPARR